MPINPKNNNDAISGKIFTIIHELIHIIIGKSGSFDLEKLQACDDDIEQFCNKCAAEFLVPEQDLLRELKNKRNIENQDVEDLAKVFKVSSLVIIRRLLDISAINLEDFYNFYDSLVCNFVCCFFHIQKQLLGFSANNFITSFD